MGLITPVTALPARNASPAGAITASGPTVRFYGTLTSGSITLSLIQRLSGGDWDFVRLPSGDVASVVADAGASDGTNYLDVANLNAGTLYALYSSTPAPSSLRAYVTELTDPSAGQYTGPALSNVNPASVSATADVTYGAATTAARSDHVHDIGSSALLIAVPIGSTTPAAGAFTTLSAATSVSLGAGVTVTGATGAGAMALGAMTGNFTFPTGNIAYTGAATKTITLAAQGAASLTSAAGLTLTGGAASALTTSAGALTLTSAAAATWSTAAGALGIDAAAALNLGATNATAVNIGHSSVLATFSSKTAAGAATNAITDPGNAGAIAVTANGVCDITTAGAETRTLAIPTFVGQRILLCLDTDGGDCVVTVASSFNQAGNTIITFNDAGDSVELVGRTVGGTRKWQLAFNDGATLS
jgi:hypothetical protein